MDTTKPALISQTNKRRPERRVERGKRGVHEEGAKGLLREMERDNAWGDTDTRSDESAARSTPPSPTRFVPRSALDRRTATLSIHSGRSTRRIWILAKAFFYYFERSRRWKSFIAYDFISIFTAAKLDARIRVSFVRIIVRIVRFVEINPKPKKKLFVRRDNTRRKLCENRSRIFVLPIGLKIARFRI